MRLRLLVATTLLQAVSLAHGGAYEEIVKAANQADNTTVVDLLKRGMDVNTADDAGSTLLMIAVRTGNVSLFETLLANRANVNRRNQFGDSALLMAALKGRGDMVKLLIDKGAEVNTSGWTPLHYAIFGGHFEVAAVLIAKGANLDSRAPNGQTPLMIAVKQGKLELVEQLIDADADMDLADFEGNTAIGLARKLEHEEIVTYLRNAGAAE